MKRKLKKKEFKETVEEVHCLPEEYSEDILIFEDGSLEKIVVPDGIRFNQILLKVPVRSNKTIKGKLRYSRKFYTRNGKFVENRVTTRVLKVRGNYAEASLEITDKKGRLGESVVSNSDTIEVTFFDGEIKVGKKAKVVFTTFLN